MVQMIDGSARGCVWHTQGEVERARAGGGGIVMVVWWSGGNGWWWWWWYGGMVVWWSGGSELASPDSSDPTTGHPALAEPWAGGDFSMSRGAHLLGPISVAFL